MRVGVIGAGIGGLATAVGLQQAGAEVVVLERATAPRVHGSALSIWGNGFTALEVLGLHDQIREIAGRGVADLQGGQRTPDGGWLARIPGHATTRLGVVDRTDLQSVLLGALEPGTVRFGSEAQAVPASGDAITVSQDGSAGDVAVERFDVVVAADGIGSRVRSSWPGDPGVRYAGYSAWRGITATPVDVLGAAGETWGRGLRFGLAPMRDGRVYWFAVVSMPAGTVLDDEYGTVRRLFGGWHEPIPTVLDATPAEGVFRLDINDLAAPLRSFRQGRCVLLGDAAHAMTPDLGQGGGQALEDAATLVRLLEPLVRDRGRGPAALEQALAEYDRVRRPRTQRIARRARAVGAVAQARSAVGQTARDALVRLLPASATARQLLDLQAWQPPGGASAR